MTRLAENHKVAATWFGQIPEGRTPFWLDELRRAGAERFAATGFPSAKDEEWRFTQLSPIVGTSFRPAEREVNARRAAEGIERFTFGRQAACELVFVNGHFEAQLSKLPRLPRGVQVMSLAEAAENEPQLVRQHLARHAKFDANPFVALNTGSLHNGAFVHIARGVVLEQPIHLLFLSSPGDEPTAAHPRILAVVEDGAIATLVETYAATGDGTYFSNAVTEIVAGADARIDHCKLQQESTAAYHVASMQVHLARASTFVSHSASIGSRITRNDLNVCLAGAGADATLNGLVLIGGEQHVDNHTTLDHAAPNCPSHELYKHVLGGKSSAVFKGKILVHQIAQKTDSKQTSKSLLLSDEAVINSQPALEIYADDVKCTHGSTVGPVDEDQVFYLRSRGVSLEAARHLLTYAFAADVTRRIKVAPVRERLESYMAAQHGLPQDLRITDLGSHDEAARNL
jgi:Fe-S cluster assembly protein SufD